MTENKFIEELQKIGINVNDTQLKQLDMYYNLLIEWNNKINLTAITNKEDVYLKHFYDSLTIAKTLDLNHEYSLCDIGTGAGFPGIVLKIIFPKLNITLLDALGKRITFLNEVIEKLQLTNIKAVHTRCEDYAKNNREIFDLATARAVAPLSILLEYSIPLLKTNGKFIAMKSNVEEELSKIGNSLKQLNTTLELKKEFNLPIENSLRTIVIFKKTNKTNAKYPRKFNEIKKKPL